jgi:hypothetical protein
MHLRFEAARRIEQAIASSDLKRAHAKPMTLPRKATEVLLTWRP